MNNEIFTDEELKFINCNPLDTSNTIYATYPILSSDFYVYVNHITPGKYQMDLHTNKNIESFRKSIKYLGKINSVNGTKVSFSIKMRRSFLIFAELNLADGIELVKNLRKQVVLNNRIINEKKRLIAKQIKTYTNLGEQYNRNSFIDTILECMENNEELLVDCSKSAKDQDVKFLCLMQITQQENNIAKKQQILDAQKTELEQRKVELLKQ